MKAIAVSPKDLAEDLLELWSHTMRTQSENHVIALFEELDLTITHVKTLGVLDSCASELSVKELAERLGLSLPAASRTAEALLKRGWVQRREDKLDRRIKRLELTQEGRAVVRRIHSARLEGLEAFVANLPDSHRDRLCAALRPLLEDLR